MPLKPEVLDRLLLSKSFLEKIRFQPVAVHDRHTLAANIIAGHDAAELAIAGVCDQLGCLPQKGVSFSWTISSPARRHQHFVAVQYGEPWSLSSRFLFSDHFEEPCRRLCDRITVSQQKRVRP
jgi:hypothetical protein